MGTQLDTQPQVFRNNVVIGTPAGGPKVSGLSVYGDISASGTIYGQGLGGGGGGVALPTGTNNQVLTYNESAAAWEAKDALKELPQTAISGDVLTYNGSTATWVASAKGFNASLNTNGWQMLPSGLIMQWGTADLPSKPSIGDPNIVNLPIRFPNAIFFASAAADGGNSTSGELAEMDFSNIVTTLSTLSIYTNYAGIVKYFAIGY